VPDQMCDVLNRNPCARQQRDETVPQLSRCPFLRVEPACSAIWRNARRTLAASRGVPRCVVKTRSLSGHRVALRIATLSLPASVRSNPGSWAWLGINSPAGRKPLLDARDSAAARASGIDLSG
jgi:hypothetical protein